MTSVASSGFTTSSHPNAATIVPPLVLPPPTMDTLQERAFSLRQQGLLDSMTYQNIARISQRHGSTSELSSSRKRRNCDKLPSKELPKNSAPIDRCERKLSFLRRIKMREKPETLFRAGLQAFVVHSSVEVEAIWGKLFQCYLQISNTMNAFYVVLIGMILHLEWKWKRFKDIAHLLGQIEVVFRVSQIVPVPKYKPLFMTLYGCYYAECPQKVCLDALFQSSIDHLLEPKHWKSPPRPYMIIQAHFAVQAVQLLRTETFAALNKLSLQKLPRIIPEKLIEKSELASLIEANLQSLEALLSRSILRSQEPVAKDTSKLGCMEPARSRGFGNNSNSNRKAVVARMAPTTSQKANAELQRFLCSFGLKEHELVEKISTVQPNQSCPTSSKSPSCSLQLEKPATPNSPAVICGENALAEESPSGGTPEVQTPVGQMAVSPCHEVLTHPVLLFEKRDLLAVTAPNEVEIPQVSSRPDNNLHQLLDKPECINDKEETPLAALAGSEVPTLPSSSSSTVGSMVRRLSRLVGNLYNSGASATVYPAATITETTAITTSASSVVSAVSSNLAVESNHTQHQARMGVRNRRLTGRNNCVKTVELITLNDMDLIIADPADKHSDRSRSILPNVLCQRITLPNWVE